MPRPKIEVRPRMSRGTPRGRFFHERRENELADFDEVEEIHLHDAANSVFIDELENTPGYQFRFHKYEEAGATMYELELKFRFGTFGAGPVSKDVALADLVVGEPMREHVRELVRALHAKIEAEGFEHIPIPEHVFAFGNN